MFNVSVDPVVVHLGPLEVRYYGLMYVLAFVCAYFLLRKLVRERAINVSNDDVANLLAYVLLGGVVGARMVYVAVYNLSYYLAHPAEILSVWNGGLSFHGGLLGGLLVGYAFCRKRKIAFYQLADLTVIPFALGLFFGRIGNFLNGELYGRITSVPWAVKFDGVEGYRHPSQLYEALKNLFMFIVLLAVRKKAHAEGFLFWLFIMMYGLLRFLIEFMRAPDPQLGVVLGPLTMGQLLTLPMFVIGLIMVWRKRKLVVNNHIN